MFAGPFQLPINLQPAGNEHSHFDLQSYLTRNVNESPSAKLHQKSAKKFAHTSLVDRILSSTTARRSSTAGLCSQCLGRRHHFCRLQTRNRNEANLVCKACVTRQRRNEATPVFHPRLRKCNEKVSYCGAHVGIYSETVKYVTHAGSHNDMATQW